MGQGSSQAGHMEGTRRYCGAKLHSDILSHRGEKGTPDQFSLLTPIPMNTNRAWEQTHLMLKSLPSQLLKTGSGPSWWPYSN